MTKAVCRDCGIEKTKVWNGVKRNSSGGKVYIDDAGRWWNGRQCPFCKNGGCKKSPSDGHGLVGPVVETNPLTHRSCVRCKTTLRAHRYFYCVPCTPITEFWDMGESYQVLHA